MSTNTAEIVEKDLSFRIVGGFFRVYNALGSGFLEQIYSRALEIVLRQAGLRVEREVPIPVIFEGSQIGFHRLDMLIEGRIAVEIKATQILPASSHDQLRNYLAALRLDGRMIPLGILLHFGPKPKYYRHLGVSRIRDRSRDSRHSVVPAVPSPSEISAME